MLGLGETLNAGPIIPGFMTGLNVEPIGMFVNKVGGSMWGMS